MTLPDGEENKNKTTNNSVSMRLIEPVKSNETANNKKYNKKKKGEDIPPVLKTVMSTININMRASIRYKKGLM